MVKGWETKIEKKRLCSLFCYLLFNQKLNDICAQTWRSFHSCLLVACIFFISSFLSRLLHLDIMRGDIVRNGMRTTKWTQKKNIEILCSRYTFNISHNRTVVYSMNCVYMHKHNKWNNEYDWCFAFGLFKNSSW